jgi:hypothetical protein
MGKRGHEEENKEENKVKGNRVASARKEGE